MATIETAKQKLANKVATMPSNYYASVGEFLGVSPGQIAGSAPGKNYALKINGAMPDRWAANLRRAFGV